MRVSAPVPKSKPVAHTMMSNSRTPSAVSIPRSVMRTIGVCPRSTSETFGLVERLVVAGDERRPLLAEAVVLRDQLLGGLGIVDDAADLLGDELAPLGVRGRGRTAGRCSCWRASRSRGCSTSSRRTPAARRRSRRRWRGRAAGGGTRRPTCSSTSRIASKSARSCACSSAVIGALLSGVHQLAVRWYTVSDATSSAMAGIDLHAARPGADRPRRACRRSRPASPATARCGAARRGSRRARARRGRTAPRARRSRRRGTGPGRSVPSPTVTRPRARRLVVDRPR